MDLVRIGEADVFYSSDDMKKDYCKRRKKTFRNRCHFVIKEKNRRCLNYAIDSSLTFRFCYNHSKHANKKNIMFWLLILSRTPLKHYRKMTYVILNNYIINNQ